MLYFYWSLDEIKFKFVKNIFLQINEKWKYHIVFLQAYAKLFAAKTI